MTLTNPQPTFFLTKSLVLTIGLGMLAGCYHAPSNSAAAPDQATVSQTGKNDTPSPDDRNKVTDTKSGTEFASVGAVKKDSEKGGSAAVGSFPSVGKQEAAPQDTKTAPVLPTDRNGVVGSPMASTINSTATANKGEALDVNQYPYSARDKFKTDMQTRLNAVNLGLDNLKSQPNRSVSDQNIQALRTRDSEVAQKLAQVDQVKSSEWPAFKQSFRTDVLALEKSYTQMSTALR